MEWWLVAVLGQTEYFFKNKEQTKQGPPKNSPAPPQKQKRKWALKKQGPPPRLPMEEGGLMIITPGNVPWFCVSVTKSQTWFLFYYFFFRQSAVPPTRSAGKGEWGIARVEIWLPITYVSPFPFHPAIYCRRSPGHKKVSIFSLSVCVWESNAREHGVRKKSKSAAPPPEQQGKVVQQQP